MATTWVKISIDMPLPMPRSVISSPSHMITAVPAVIVITMTRKVEVLVVVQQRQAAAESSWPDRASATMPVACSRASPKEVTGVLRDLGLLHCPPSSAPRAAG